MRTAIVRRNLCCHRGGNCRKQTRQDSTGRGRLLGKNWELTLNRRMQPSALSGLFSGVAWTADSHETLRDSCSRENPSTLPFTGNSCEARRRRTGPRGFSNRTQISADLADQHGFRGVFLKRRQRRDRIDTGADGVDTQEKQAAKIGSIRGHPRSIRADVELFQSSCGNVAHDNPAPLTLG